jgi:putative ABC transport system permease protein
MFLKLASKSLLNRKGSVILTIMAMTVSIFVLLGVEHIRSQTKASFNNTISGVDLIVGARTGSLNLLLYSVFRIGSPTNNINWQTYQAIVANSKVAWTIPISLGDSHKGYRVMGTTDDYFTYFSYGAKRQLRFTAGKPFKELFDVVIGAEVASALNYSVGDSVVLAHGLGKTSFSMHDDRPFTVVGILAPTGTPVDQVVHVSLQGIEAIHLGWQQGVKMPSKNNVGEHLSAQDLQPKNITAVMLGLNSKMATFSLQRDINTYRKEPLSAILPGVALAELWQIMGLLENTLRLISSLILTAALFGLSAMMLASIKERKHEIHLLRVIGASPGFVFLLIELEALLISLASIFIAILSLYLSIFFIGDSLASNFGLQISENILSNSNISLLILLIISAAMIAAAIPSFLAYKNAKASR